MGRYRSCAVKGCRDTDSRRHGFPSPDKYPDRFRMWLEACGNDELMSLSSTTVLANKKICHIHFAEDVCTSNNLLSIKAVPTLFLPWPITERTKLTTNLDSETIMDVIPCINLEAVGAEICTNMKWITNTKDSSNESKIVPNPSIKSEISITGSMKNTFNVSIIGENRIPCFNFDEGKSGKSSNESDKCSTNNIKRKSQMHNINQYYESNEIDTNDMLCINNIDGKRVQFSTLAEDSEIRQRLRSEDVMLYRLSDAEIRFDKICRACFSTTNVKCIFDVMYNNVRISDLLKQYVSVDVNLNDKFPKHICDTCVSELIACYKFKVKCVQTQLTLEKIIKYDNSTENQSVLHIPFVLHVIERDRTDDIIFNKHEEVNAHSINEKWHNENVNVLDQYDVVPLDIKSIENKNPDIVKGDKTCFELFQKKHEGVQRCALPKKYICDICGNMFVNSYRLKLHIRMHTKERPHKCEVCNKSFSLKPNLIRHRLIHTGQKPYKCDICNRGFNQTGSLKEHKRLHKSKLSGEKSYLCNYCGKGFYSYAGFLVHLKIHTVGIQRYCCEVCDKSFSKPGYLKTHALSHSGETPYMCHICSKLFAQNSYLQHHIKTHSKPHKCLHCSKTFSLKRELVVHVRTHTNEAPYVCDLCGETFRYSKNVKKHKCIQHISEDGGG